MRFKTSDKKGLGALGAIILIIILLAVAFVGATAAMPYVVSQDFAVGDTLNYEWTESNGTVTESFTETNTITAVTATTVTYDWTFGDLTGTSSETIVKEGSKLYINDVMFINPALLPDERSYTVVLIGFTPMLVEAYTIEITGGTFDFWVKAGTLLIVKSVLTEGDFTESRVLSDTSMMWVKLF